MRRIGLEPVVQLWNFPIRALKRAINNPNRNLSAVKSLLIFMSNQLIFAILLLVLVLHCEVEILKVDDSNRPFNEN